jgi:eukaryotic-like serine/threonine-protein kinase
MSIARHEPTFLDSKPSEPAVTLKALEYELKEELPPTSIIGRTLSDRYLPEALLRAGAFSAQYRASDLAIGEAVCIEFLPRRAVGSWSKVRQAVDKLAALGDPNIVEVVGRGMAGGAWPFLVTEYSDRATLRDLLNEGNELALARIVRIGAQTAEALAAAHGAGVVHGSLAPERIFYSGGGRAHESIKVSGFGLAALIEASPDALLSSSSEVYQYASPEQVEGQPIETRSDIYSLGVILHELVAGKPPFEGNAISVLRQHLRSDPPPASRDRGSSELALRVFDKIIGRCLAKRAGDRYPNAAHLAADLARLGAALAQARAAAAEATAAKPRQKEPDAKDKPSSPHAARADRTSGVQLRPAQYPPQKRAAAPELPKVIVQGA